MLVHAYIKNIQLKGYKSIQDLSIRLNPGLNIIIGTNGSGKTNFVEFVKRSLSLHLTLDDAQKTPYFLRMEIESKMGRVALEECFEGKWYAVTNGVSQGRRIKSSISITNDLKKTIQKHEEEYLGIAGLMVAKDILPPSEDITRLLFPKLIPFTIPSSFDDAMLSQLGRISLSYNDTVFKILSSVLENNLEYDKEFNDLYKEKNSSIEKIKEYLNLKKSLLLDLKNYSPIKSLRLSPALNITLSEKRIDINYILLEFWVNNTWLSWEQLSDGTKRLFHIIVQINDSKGLVLLEEPENGVHPDQLYLLMDFLKEQSKQKQIILTTHSPEVLNILNKDELDAIIVTRFEEDKGTLMHHLSAKKQKEGQKYMTKVAHLSDFWVHSNLEKYDAAEY